MAAADQRRSLIFVTRSIEVPAAAGAPIRTHRLLTGLADAFDVTLLTFEHRQGSPHEPMTAAEMRAALPGVDVVTVPGLGTGKRAAQLASLPRRRSYEWGRYRSRRLSSALREEVAHRRPAVVHFDDPGVAVAGPVSGAPLNAFAPHNVESRILAETARSATGVRRAYAAAEARKITREERDLWRAMDVCVAVSHVDAASMRAGGARRVLVCPNGADPVEPLPAPRLATGGRLRLLFVGTVGYWPNEQGVTWFVRDVLPRVQAEVDAVLDVVGSPAARPVEGPGVTHHGRVADLRPFYDRAHAVVVPLHHGSGTRLKVVEAMAYGRPVVSTLLGAEGLPVRAGEHFMAADDAQGFAHAIVDLVRRLRAGDPPLAMLTAARAAAQTLLWPSLASRLARDYGSALAERSPQR